jgi:hypothetical protein
MCIYLQYTKISALPCGISKIAQGLGYLKRAYSTTKILSSLLLIFMVDSSGSTVHLLSPFWSQAFHVLEGSLLISEFVHPLDMLVIKPRRSLVSASRSSTCTSSHTPRRGPCSSIGVLQSELDLVIAIAILCRLVISPQPLPTYHVSSTRLARVPLPRVALHGTEAKADLRGLGTVLGIFGDLGQSWTTTHRSSST